MKRKKLMVLGPVEIEKDILKIGAQQQEYMRTQDYSNKWSKIFDNLKYVFQTKNTPVVFASSGTGAMEAAVSNLLSKGDKAIYINGGTFGKRWGEICNKFGINTVEIPVEFGSTVELETVKKYLEENQDAKVLLATLNETSSGALSDIKGIGEIVKEYNILFVVDCVSGLVADKFNQDEWNVDVAVSASQKAFALPAGLGFASFNEKALELAAKSTSRTYYFDIFEYVNNAKRNQTPFTPAVSIVNQLEKRLEKIRKEGLENIQAKYKENSEFLRNEIEKLGFKTLAKSRANCTTAVYSEPYDASKIVEILRNKYNIEIAPSGGELKTKLFRVGNYGSINKKDIKNFIKCLKKTLKEIEKRN